MAAEVIVALDVPEAEEALSIVDAIDGLRWVKLGPVLFVREGPRIVAEMKRRGLRVFLDLKWHDIPNTVRGAVTSAAALGVDMATVHALGGEAMMSAAVDAAGQMSVVAVSVLTSHDNQSISSVLGRDTAAASEVGRLAVAARDAGVSGMVCSADEVADVRALFGPDAHLVVPGIRFRHDQRGDQARVAGPSVAVERGASHLVVGRPIVEAEDVGAAFREFSQAAGT